MGTTIFIILFLIGRRLFQLKRAKDKPRDIVQIFKDSYPGTLGYVRKDGK